MKHRIALLASLAAFAVYAVVFYTRQNAGLQPGGPISVAKMLWLSYAIAGWFIVPLFLWLDRSLDASVRRIFGWFLAAFLARGLIEFVLIYFVFHWTPVYGITHDLLCIAIAGGFALRARPTDTRSARARRYAASLVVGLVAEIAFAGMFLQTGMAKQGVYFAADEPRWLHVNLATCAALLFVYPDLVATLVGLYWPGLAHDTPRTLLRLRAVAGVAACAAVLVALATWKGLA